MFVALLLFACVGPASSEWVEISQQHYRKPVRLTHNYPATPDDQYKHIAQDITSSTLAGNERPVRITPGHPEEDSRFKFNRPLQDIHNDHHKSQERIYSNITLAEKAWNRDRVPVKNRVNIDDLKLPDNVRAFDPGWHDSEPDDLPEFVTKNIKYIKGQDSVPAVIERVPHVGSVKRVHLANTPVKSPSIKNSVSTASNVRINSFVTTPANKDASDEFVIKSDNIFKDSHEIMNAKIPNDSPAVDNSETPINNYKIITSTNKPTQLNQQKELDSKKDNNKSYNKLSENTDQAISKISTSSPQLSFETKSNDKAAKVTRNDQNKQVKDNLRVEDNDEKYVNDGTAANNNKYYNQSEIPKKTVYPKSQSEKSHDNDDPHDVPLMNERNKINDDIKVNTMENVIKFMKVVTETISKNTKRGVNGKVKYLNELKDTLLGSIKSRIDATWPEEAAGHRSSRSTARGHVEFPSSESSLMTISFLTFAVFLIKLVLQVIHTYKNKTMMVAPLVVATAGRATRKLRHFH